MSIPTEPKSRFMQVDRRDGKIIVSNMTEHERLALLVNGFRAGIIPGTLTALANEGNEYVLRTVKGGGVG